MSSLTEQTPTGTLLSLYRATTAVVAPAVAPVLLCSARGRRRLSERFGGWSPVGRVSWWFHGASIGEVQGILPVVASLKQDSPEVRTLLTCTSPTGLDRGVGQFDEMRLLPLDAPWCVRRALRRVTPGGFVACETELWPSLYSELMKRHVPCYLVNARISDYTIGRYRVLSGLLRPILSRITRICAVSEQDRDRFIELGASPESIRVTGHAKYDTAPSVTNEAERDKLRNILFPGGDTGPIIVLGSLRPGEEVLWLSAYQRVRAAVPSLKLVVAPRHAEKFRYFEDVLKNGGFRYAKWSEPSTENRDVLLLDTMGRLESVYASAALAFVGATLVDVGGHNPLEPAMYGVPVCVGPYVRNIRDIVADMKGVDALLTVESATEIFDLVSQVGARDAKLDGVGKRGRQVWLRHSGAASRVRSWLEATAT